MNKRPRLLVVAPSMCRGDTASGDLRLQRILEILARFAAVDLLVPEPEPARGQPSRRYWQLLRDAGVRIVDWRFHRRLSIWCESQGEPYDWIVAEFWHEAERITSHVARIRRRQPALRFAIDTVDVHYLREDAAVKCGVGDYGSAADVEDRRVRELATYRQAELLLACTAEDLRALAADVPNVSALVVPNIIRSLPRSPGPRDHDLVFVGGFRHAPNVDAVTWFVREVFPLVEVRLPAVRLNIIGSHTPEVIKDFQAVPGVHVVGFIEDTSAWLDRAAVSVAPLRYGAGMKGKVTEALSAGTPVVTTTVGAQGLGAVSGVHLHVADTAAAFADAVVVCLEDPLAAEAMGARGRELVESICGAERVRGDLLDALSHSAPERPASTGRPGVWHRAQALLSCRLWILWCQAARVNNAIRFRLGRLLNRFAMTAAGPDGRSS